VKIKFTLVNIALNFHKANCSNDTTIFACRSTSFELEAPLVELEKLVSPLLDNKLASQPANNYLLLRKNQDRYF
jgi:hypothetical protein